MTTYANPGAIGDVVTATSIETTWGNAIRDRVIQNFASTTARDAAITSPVLGMHCYVAGVGLQQYCGATALWQKPWYMPWGRQARQIGGAISDAHAVATEVILSAVDITFTAVANRLYRFEFQMVIQNLAAAESNMTVKIKDNTTVIEQRRLHNMDASGIRWLWYEVEGTLTAGSHTIHVTLQASNAAGFTNRGDLYSPQHTIFDVGNSGDPP